MEVSTYSISSHFPHVKRIPEIWYFAGNLRANLGRYSMTWAIRGLYMLLEAHANLLMHLRKNMKHFSSNGSFSSYHRIPFPVLIAYPQSSILYGIWESVLAKIAQIYTLGVHRSCQIVLLSSLLLKGRLWKTSSSMDVSPYSTVSHFPCQEHTWNLIFSLNLRLNLGRYIMA